MHTIHFGREQHEYLSVCLRGRTYPSSNDYWDGNWLTTLIEVAAGGFRGKVDALLRVEELIEFRTQLAALANSPFGKARFTTMEEWLSLELSGDRLGHIELLGELRDQPGIGNLLRFRLTSDQTELRPMIAALGDALAAFPLLGRPNEQ